MIRISVVVFLLLAVLLQAMVLAAPREKAAVPSVRPLAVATETKAEIAR